jgi:hypothetical protein
MGAVASQAAAPAPVVQEGADRVIAAAVSAAAEATDAFDVAQSVALPVASAWVLKVTRAVGSVGHAPHEEMASAEPGADTPSLSM